MSAPVTPTPGCDARADQQSAAPGAPRRPGPLRWLAYAYGAGLPDRFDEWVLRDTTSRTWAWRHLARIVVQVAPVVILILLLVPGPEWIRIGMVLGGGAMALIFGFAYAVETAEHRLMKAGYAVGTGERVRQQRTDRDRTAATARRREKIAARSARRQLKH
jgi:hypothetical protein